MKRSKKVFILSIAFMLVPTIVILLSAQFIPTRNWLILGYNTVRPLTLDGGGPKCIEQLGQTQTKFRAMGDLKDGPCIIKDAVRVSAFSETAINSPLTLSCKTAVKVDEWLKQISAKSIKHIGAYNCRSLRTSLVLSEHGFGNALDVVEIDNASVRNDWRRIGQNGSVLSNAYQKACEIFDNVIGPNDNAAHKNHFHLDTGLGLGCSLKPIIGFLKDLL
jgi:hypothetical protein